MTHFFTNWYFCDWIFNLNIAKNWVFIVAITRQNNDLSMFVEDKENRTLQTN